MLDVIHFFFEEDSRYRSQEEIQTVSAIRTQVYESLYGINYPYKVKSQATSSNNFSDVDDVNSVKPYMAPTEFDPESTNPFGKTLEPPLG